MSTTPAFKFYQPFPFCPPSGALPAAAEYIGDMGVIDLATAMEIYWKLESLEMQVSYSAVAGITPYTKDFSYAFLTNRAPNERVCEAEFGVGTYFNIFEKVTVDAVSVGMIFLFDDSTSGAPPGIYLSAPSSYTLRAQFENAIPQGFFSSEGGIIFLSVTDYGPTYGDFEQLDSQTFELSLGVDLNVYFYARTDQGPWTLSSWAFDLVPSYYTFV